jgi:NADPH-dependent 2,4-dienoyl-CoA reductase/sulfur reductase-like enzyme
VIIGNGVAGIEAALAARAREPSWEITIVSEESDHFFSRTALMWICTGQMRYRDTEPYERDLYQRLRFVRVRARATGLDLSQRLVHLADHRSLPYDRLLIACGSRPRPAPWPNGDLLGVGHFVTLQDLDWLERELYGGPASDRPPRPYAHVNGAPSPYLPRPSAAEKRGRFCERPAVIGGGLLGMEVVEILLSAKKKPKLFLRDDWFWPLLFDRDESRFLTDRMVAHGVEVLPDHEVRALEGDGTVAAVETDHGRYDADLVVVAIGVAPNTEWLKGSGLELDDKGGIVVDDMLTTSAESVLAAGDCASVRWFDGQRRPEQLWYTARHQGRVAGKRLAGDRERYDRGVWFNSAKLMDVEYTTVGLVNFDLDGEENRWLEEKGAVRSTTRIVAQHGRVVGFNMLGRRWDHEVLIRWIEERRALGWVIEHLNEAAFDTEFVPRLRVPQEEAWISKRTKE